MGGQIGVRAVLLSAALAVATLLAVAALGWQPAVGSAEVITTPGSPLTAINVESDLDCQVQANGDASPSFYLEPTDGGCGTFLALTNGSEGPKLFGPSTGSPGGAGEVDFHPVSQKIEGSTVTTKVDAEEGGPVAEIVEVDSYVPGRESYETTVTVTNLTVSALKGTLYHAGDCYLADVDTGYGAYNVPSSGGVACTIDPRNTPPARYMAFTPVAGPAASYVEGFYGTVWADMSKEGTPFPDTVDFETHEDNGMGLSWPVELAASGSAALKFTTTVSADSAPTSSSNAPSASAGGACVSDSQFPVTISAVNGSNALHYKVDGGAEETIETKEAHEVSIPLPSGQHTLEYWAEDLSGAQESPHHTVTVLVDSGAPGLTITSEQGKSSYFVGETGSVAVAATGLDITTNPAATKVAISTSEPGSFSVTRSATNACGTTSASFAYKVARNTLATLPPPVLGKTVNVEPVSGEVFVKYPPGYASASAASLADPLEAPAQLDFATESLSKGVGFVPLREARQIPVDSVLETTGGVARIATATSKPKEQQFGNFGGGIFKLLQNRKQKGLTDLNIIDNHSASQVCATVGKKGKGKAYAAKLSSKTLGRVNASGHGHFTVQGQYSAATVRGTVWNVGNRCEGTLTHVTRGVVSVRDFSRRKTITLFTGQSYVAKAPRRR
jgi:hypothetical protein